MKKTEVTRNPPQPENSSIEKKGSENIDGIFNILNKLEPQQLIGLADSVTKFASVGFEYAAECQKTKRAEIDAHVKIREIDAGLENSYLEHEQVMNRIQKDDTKDERQFKKDMENLGIRTAELEKKDKSIHRILDLLEAGEISEDNLVGIIRELKQ